MSDMSVEICGVRFKNPVIAASGTFGYGEEFNALYDIGILGGISVKGTTLMPRAGNPAARIAETPMGMLNAVGLQNPGVDKVADEILPKLSRHGTNIIVNIAGSTPDEYCKVASRLRGTCADMIELNISCPNVKNGGAQFGIKPEDVAKITADVKPCCDVPLIVKLSPNVADIRENALAAQEAGADALSLINTLTGLAIDFKRRRPVLANVTGGLSGPAVKPVALRMVYEVSRTVSIPVIGMGGITSALDVAEFMLAGASAVMVGTANFTDPFACPNIIDGLQTLCKNEGIEKITDLTGALRV